MLKGGYGLKRTEEITVTNGSEYLKIDDRRKGKDGNSNDHSVSVTDKPKESSKIYPVSTTSTIENQHQMVYNSRMVRKLSLSVITILHKKTEHDTNGNNNTLPLCSLQVTMLTFAQL